MKLLMGKTLLIQKTNLNLLLIKLNRGITF
jgi:hypothetical protein